MSPMRALGIRLAVVPLVLGLGGCLEAKQSVDQYVQNARSLEDSGDLAKATAELRKALKISPANAQVNAMLGKIEDDQGNLQQAINHYILASAADARLLQPQLRLIELMIDTNHLKEALAKVNATLGVFPSNLDALALRADAEQRQGDAMAAQADTSAVLAKQPTNARALAVLAMTRIQSRDLAGATDVVNRGLAAHPENVRLLEVRAAILLTQNDPEKAAEALRTIVRTEPSNVIAQSALAGAEADAGHFEDALNHLKDAAAAEPNNQRMQMALVTFLAQRAKASDVTAQLEALIARNPDGSTYDRTLAEYYRSRDQLPQAEQTLRNAVTRLGDKPAGRDAAVALAKAAILRSEFAAAKQGLDAVLAADPNNVDALMTSAILADKNGRIADAIAILLNVVKINPINGQAFQLLASEYTAANQPQLAVDAMQRAASVLPGDIDLQLRLAGMLQAAGRRDAQNELLTRLNLQAPNLPAPWLASGELALRRKDLATADHVVTRLRSLPNAEGAAARLAGDVQMARNDYAGALKSYQTAIQALPQPDNGLLGAYVDAANKAGVPADAAQVLEARAAAPVGDAMGLWIATMDLWANAKQPGKAEKAFKQAAQASPMEIAPYEAYVGTLVRAKDFDRARALLDAGVGPDVPRWSLALLKGTVAEQRGDVPAAAEDYRQASELNPTSARAANNYASLLADLDPKNTAALTAVRAKLNGLEQSPDPAVVDTVAWLDFRLGRLDEARLLLTQIKAGESQNPQLRFHMAAVLLASGDKAAGLALLDSVRNLTFPGSDEIKSLSAT